MSNIHIRVRDSLDSGIINGVINGIIAFFLFKDHPDISVSLNSISASEISVWGQAVSLTFGLGPILTLITAKIFCNQMKSSIRHNLSCCLCHCFPPCLALPSITWRRCLACLL